MSRTRDSNVDSDGPGSRVAYDTLIRRRQLRRLEQPPSFRNLSRNVALAVVIREPDHLRRALIDLAAACMNAAENLSR